MISYKINKPYLNFAFVAGIPINEVLINQGNNSETLSGLEGRVSLAEFGSIQVELLVLSQRTANSTYGDKSEAILKLLNQNYPDTVGACHGFCPATYSLPGS